MRRQSFHATLRIQNVDETCPRCSRRKCWEYDKWRPRYRGRSLLFRILCIFWNFLRSNAHDE